MKTERYLHAADFAELSVFWEENVPGKNKMCYQTGQNKKIWHKETQENKAIFASAGKLCPHVNVMKDEFLLSETYLEMSNVPVQEMSVYNLYRLPAGN